jgi:hypothetical protein
LKATARLAVDVARKAGVAEVGFQRFTSKEGNQRGDRVVFQSGSLYSLEATTPSRPSAFRSTRHAASPHGAIVRLTNAWSRLKRRLPALAMPLGVPPARSSSLRERGNTDDHVVG